MGQDQPGGSGVWKPMGGEGIKLERAEDDDVEGHQFKERSQKDRIEGDEDVEGHQFKERSHKERIDGDDDDVEGHKQLT